MLSQPSLITKNTGASHSVQLYIAYTVGFSIHLYNKLERKTRPIFNNPKTNILEKKTKVEMKEIIGNEGVQSSSKHLGLNVMLVYIRVSVVLS